MEDHLTQLIHEAAKYNPITKVAFGRKFSKALVYTESVHRMQTRKSTTIPYIGHLLAVASIVIDVGGTQDEAIAALLHDAAEDQGGQRRLDDIFVEFGEYVAKIVEGCSDSLVEDPSAKPDWLARKIAYLEHLKLETNASIVLVSAADKTHNLRSMLSDYEVVKDELWSRFNKSAGKVGVIKYYRSLLRIYDGFDNECVRRVAQTLKATLQALEVDCGANSHSELADGSGLIPG